MYTYFIQYNYNSMKILSAIFIIFCTLISVHGRDIYDKELPDHFKKECFEFSTSKTFDAIQWWGHIIHVNKWNTIAVRDNYLMPIIPYKQVWEKFLFTTDLWEYTEFLTDDNVETFLELDTEKTKTIKINFLDPLPKGWFEMNFRHTAEEYIPEVFISEDWIRYSPVSFKNISDFDVQSIKITYKPKDFLSCEEPWANCKRELIKIKELQFLKMKNVHLIKVTDWWEVNFYSDYHCDDSINFQTITIPFAVSTETPIEEIILEKNPYYNPNIEKDSDADGIDNFSDNCPNVSNPRQLDSDADDTGDMCSDYDDDGIVWYKDNCPTISNKDQQDINNNNVWDVCEFDKDKDWIFDSVDNCITKINPLQHDADKDWIGDTCDNCKFFNPWQKDVNWNLIGDVCDKKNEELAKNDDDVDGIMNGQDNCPYIKNEWQEDEDWDAVGDVCDNCKTFKNENQLDFNKNDVGDICEDSDGDWVQWMEDNCINTSNSNQKDTDNDWVGDLCEDDDKDWILFKIDNCPFEYNPFQKDTDKDNIWDACDSDDDRVLESNKNFVMWGLILLTLLFIWAIFVMWRKVSKKNTSQSKKKPKSSFKKEIIESESLHDTSYTNKKKDT